MRLMITLTIAAIVLSMSMTAVADLQDVEIDGKLTIRGNRVEESPDYGSDYQETWIEQRVLLGVRADFTDEVSAYIQFDNYSIWGEDFRSDDWESGVDSRSSIDDDNAEVEVYQAYITAAEMWGLPINLKVGRQELIYGSEWLLGNNDSGFAGFGLSHDALRIDYASDSFSVSAVASKLNDRVMGDLFENDQNMYMLYASCVAIEDMVFDTYFIYLEDELLDVDFWTVGLRGAGTFGPLDFEAEVAYQDQNENMGDDEYLAGNLEVGYQLDMVWMPRIFIGGAYFEGSSRGEDDSSSSGGAFNRLFSDVRYSTFDRFCNDTDMWLALIGVGVNPTESISSELKVTYFEEDEGSDTMGTEVVLQNTYQYTEDLAFSLQSAFFFGDDAVADTDYMYNGLSAEISF